MQDTTNEQTHYTSPSNDDNISTAIRPEASTTLQVGPVIASTTVAASTFGTRDKNKPTILHDLFTGEENISRNNLMAGL